MEQLEVYGWTNETALAWSQLARADLQVGRVVADFGTSLKVATPQILTAELSGKLAHYTPRDEAPKVGDWVGFLPSDHGNAVIEVVLPRRSEIARLAAGNRTAKQIIATNVDVAFVLLALDDDFSVERLQRFLYQLSINAVTPIIVLNKADKTSDVQSYVDKLKEFDAPIIIATATVGRGIDEILAHILPGQTAVLLGSSGVGKSTLTNRLLGRDEQKTQAVRERDATGKHTTVHRELFMLPGGGMLIDMPGMREIQLWGTQENLDDNFDDVAALIRQCKYTTCQHGTEEGCAIRAALADGTLDPAHYARYRKMQAELAVLQQKNVARERLGSKKSRQTLKRQKRQDSLDDLAERDL